MRISFQHNRFSYFTGEKSDSEKQIKKEKYKDPLLDWPIRGLAYSNELGAALSEIAPKLGTLLWFPAMLYFGADFYDKYKNEKTSYDPNAQRGTRQVIFQILASVILPTASVVAGQKITSVIAILNKEGLPLQTREEIIKFIQTFTGRRHIDHYKDDIKKFKTLFEESLVTKREKMLRSNKIKHPLRTIFEVILKNRHPEYIAMSQKEKILKFADKNIDMIFDMYQKLVNNQKPEEFSDSMWQKFNNLKNKYLKDPDFKKTYIRDAAEDIIMKFQQNQIMKSKLMKTLGGFIALGIAIKPIDKFVENVILKKYVDPQLHYLFDTRNKNNIPNALKLE